MLGVIATSCGAVAPARRALATGSLLVLLIAVTGSACTSPDSAPSHVGPDAWPVYRLAREGPGEEIGEITLTDPAGGPPRPARIGTHGIRIVLDAQAGEAVGPADVRVVYSRRGAADTRAFVAVEVPGEAGVYLGTVDLVAAGEWRIRVSIVGGGGGSAQITVPGR